MADVLLHEWENRAFPPHNAAYAAARPLAVAALAALLSTLVYRRPGDLALDLEDVRDTLRRARAFGLGYATAAGPGRLVPAAASRQAHLGPPPAGPPALALLHLGSHPAAELEMDELSEITETLQATLGPDVELIFWHGCDNGLPPAAVRLWLLLGYGKP